MSHNTTLCCNIFCPSVVQCEELNAIRAEGKAIMASEYLTKGAAVFEIMQATGYGRQVIEKKMVELETKGQIAFVDDLGDTRKKLISRQHVDIVIAALTRR